VISRIGGRLLATVLLSALAACGSSNQSAQSGGTSDPCNPSGIASAIDAASASNDAPAKRGDRLDDLVAGIVQCEASSATAQTDRHDPLNLQLARANLAAGNAYAQAGQKSDAMRYLSTASYTAKFIGDAQIQSEAAGALKNLR
jgi:hypothetical protein